MVTQRRNCIDNSRLPESPFGPSLESRLTMRLVKWFVSIKGTTHAVSSSSTVGADITIDVYLNRIVFTLVCTIRIVKIKCIRKYCGFLIFFRLEMR